MAQEGIEHRVMRTEKYNPNFETYQKEEFPTNTVKRAGRVTAKNVGTLLAKYSTGPGSYILVTRFELGADRASEFVIRDRTGTVGYIYLEAAGMHSELGAIDAPVIVLKGTAQFRNLAGTSAGTYICSFEGLVPQFGTQTIS